MPDNASAPIRTLPRLAYALIAAGVFVADQVTKGLVESRIPPFSVVTVIPHFFNLTNTKNPGAAFGLFADSPARISDHRGAGPLTSVTLMSAR